MDEKELSVVRAYLNLKKVISSGTYGPKIIGALEKIYNENTKKKIVEEAKKNYPIEFVDNIKIIFTKDLLKKILLEVRLSEEENLERGCILVSSVQYAENKAILKFSNFLSFNDLVKSLGPIERDKSGINFSKTNNY